MAGAILEDIPKGMSTGWQAGLDVCLSLQQNATRMTQLSHWGPLRVQRPFYPNDTQKECHIYLLHPPGGMVSGDQLTLNLCVENGGHGLFTTPSAGKVYRGNHDNAARQQQVVNCRISGNSYMEWLPQETIVFNGARGDLSVSVELDSDSQCCLWDIVCLGRPASGEQFTQGYLYQRLNIKRNGIALYNESNRFVGGSALLNSPWGLAKQPVSGSLVVTAALSPAQLDHLKTSVDHSNQEPAQAAVSDLGEGLLVVRYIGPSAEHCKQLFIDCWRQLRPLITGTPIQPPRIWAT